MQTGKVFAPVSIKVLQGKDEVDGMDEARRLLKKHAGLKIAPEHLMKGWTRTRELETKSSSTLQLPPRRLQTAEQRQNGPPPLPPVSTRRAFPDDARRSLVPAFDTTKWKRPHVIRPRLLRRRVQVMMQKMPTLTVRIPVPGDDGMVQKAEGKKPKRKEATFTVQLLDKAAGEKGRYREMSEEERWWLEKETVPPLKIKEKKKK